MWSCSELFARDLKATVEKAQGHQTNKKKKFGRACILNLITPPIPCSWRLGPLPLPLLPAAHGPRVAHGAMRLIFSTHVAFFSAGTLPSSQSLLGWEDFGKGFVVKMVHFHCWIRETGKIAGMHPRKAVVS